MAELTQPMGGGVGFPLGQGTRGRVPRIGRSVDGMEDSPYASIEGTISIAQLKACRATPIELVPAPGAGKVLQFLGLTLIYDYAAVYTESSDNLVVKYTDGSGGAASEILEATGFLDATADAMRPMVPAIIAPVMVANAALVLHNNGDGEFGGTGSPLRFKVMYAVHVSGL